MRAGLRNQNRSDVRESSGAGKTSQEKKGGYPAILSSVPCVAIVVFFSVPCAARAPAILGANRIPWIVKVNASGLRSQRGTNAFD